MAITDVFKKPIFKVDGITLTVGILLLILVAFYFFYWRKK